MDDYTRDLENLLYMANDRLRKEKAREEKPMYDLKIIDKETITEYKIKELKEMKEILEQYQGKEIGVELHRVRSDKE